MRIPLLKWLGVMLVLVAGGCSTQPRRVDCEERLQPINAPTPAAVKPEVGHR